MKSIICEYLSDCLSDSRRKEVELHIAQCFECSAELRNVEQMVRSLRSLSHRSPIDCWPGVRERILSQRIKQSISQGSWSRLKGFLFRPVVAAPAVIVALLLVLFLIIWPINVNEPPSRRSYPEPDYSRFITVHSRSNQQQAFTDPDVILVSAELAKARSVTDSGR